MQILLLYPSIFIFLFFDSSWHFGFLILSVTVFPILFTFWHLYTWYMLVYLHFLLLCLKLWHLHYSVLTPQTLAASRLNSIHMDEPSSAPVLSPVTSALCRHTLPWSCLGLCHYVTVPAPVHNSNASNSPVYLRGFLSCLGSPVCWLLWSCTLSVHHDIPAFTPSLM